MIKTDQEGLFEEYKTLRDETMKRAEFGFTIINLGFIACSGLWIAAFSSGKFELLACYPFLALLFALGHISNQVIAADVGHYIREVLEKDVCELRWATYFETRGFWGWLTGNLFTLGIFGLGSALSLFLYYDKLHLTLDSSHELDKLFGAALASTFLTLLLLILGATYKSNNDLIKEKIRKINFRKLRAYLYSEVKKSKKMSKV